MLAMGQQVLILDEPTFGQDERNANALLALLDELNQAGKTIIVITHDMRLVAEHASRVAVMNAGEILFDGRPNELTHKPDLLSRARLNLPPLARLSALLSTQFPVLRNATTMADYLALGH
jgi:energy-coupling factor transport system ATP-binding protein